MTWECSSQVADDCVEGDLFDPPYQQGDAAICGPCARALDLTDSPMAKQFDFRNGTPVEPTDEQLEDTDDDQEDNT